MAGKSTIAGYLGGGIFLISVLHTWYASGVYGGRIRIGLPFVANIGFSIPVRYAYGLDLFVLVITFGLAYAWLSTLPPLDELSLPSLRDDGTELVVLGLALTFLPQISGASWSKATLAGLVTLTGMLVLLSYAYPIPTWEIAVLYLSLVFGAFTIGGEWLSFAETVSAYRFRPMSYFVISMTYIIGGSLWLLVGNVSVHQVGRSDSGASPSRWSPDSPVLTALSSPLIDTSGSDEPESVAATAAREAADTRKAPVEVAGTGLPSRSASIDPDTTPTLEDVLFSRHEPIHFDSPAVLLLSSPDPTAMSALRLLCAETYREGVGDQPETIVLRDPGAGFEEEIQPIERGIVCVQFSDAEWEEIRGDQGRRRSFWDRFYPFVKNERCVVIMNTDGVVPPDEYYVRMLRFDWRSLSPEHVRRICRLCCGYLPDDGEKPSDDDNRVGVSSRRETRAETGSVDAETVHIEAYRELMLDALRSYADERRGLFHDVTAERTEPESSLHLALKQFVVRWIAEAEGLDGSPAEIASRVQTNVQTDGHLADIRVEDDVYEVETLSVSNRTTDSPRNQLQHSFTKYVHSDVESINVVVDPLTMARHLDDVVGLCYNHEDWCRRTGISVRFNVPDVGVGELIPLSRFAEDVTALLER